MKHHCLPAFCFSEDIDELHAAREAVTARRDAADRAIALADTGRTEDGPAYARASAELDQADAELAAIDDCIKELEEVAGFAEARDLRREYWGRVL